MMLADIKCGMNRQAFVLLQAMSMVERELPGMAWISTGPYSNCRECGFVIATRNQAGKHMFMAFFEHRNSDSLCCVRWIGTPNITGGYTPDDIPESAYPSKWDVTKSWPYMGIQEAIEWATDQITDHVKPNALSAVEVAQS